MCIRIREFFWLSEIWASTYCSYIDFFTNIRITGTYHNVLYNRTTSNVAALILLIFV